MKKLVLAVIMTAALSTAASAVDLTKEITQLNGKPLIDAQTGTPVKMTVGEAIENALLTTEQTTPGTEKMKRFLLASRVHDKAQATFTPEEVILIKDLVLKYQNILIAGVVLSTIDPTTAPSDK